MDGSAKQLAGILRPIALLAAGLAVAGCGAGSNAIDNLDPASIDPLTVETVDLAFANIGTWSVDRVTDAAISGQSLSSVAVDGVSRAVFPLNTFGGSDPRYSEGSNIYTLLVASDGQSFATWGEAIDDSLVGAFIEQGTTPDNLTGSVTFEGDYAGTLQSLATEPTVSGTMSITADFDSNQFVAVITDRSVDDDINLSLFDEGVVLQDLIFVGTNGATAATLDGGIMDNELDGSIAGVFYDGGIIGFVHVEFDDAGTSFPSDLEESGLFDATVE